MTAPLSQKRACRPVGLAPDRVRAFSAQPGCVVASGLEVVGAFDSSVSARASKDSLCSRTGGDVPSRDFQHA